MDFFVLKKKVHELQNKILNSHTVVKKFISLPFSGLGIVVLNNKHKECIKIYVNSDFYGIWSDERWEETANECIFINFLNQQLSDSILANIELLYDNKFKPDRIFFMKFIKKDKLLLKESILYLAVEMTGKYSNIVLCDNDFVIINSLKTSNNLIKSKYTLPYEIQNNVAIEVKDIYNFYNNKGIFKGILNFSKLLENELEHLIKTQNKSVLEEYTYLLEKLETSEKVYLIANNSIKGISLIKFQHLENLNSNNYQIYEFEKIDECLEFAYQNIYLPKRLEEFRKSLISKLNQDMKKKQSLLQILYSDAEKFKMYNAYKHWADIILCNTKYLSEFTKELGKLQICSSSNKNRCENLYNNSTVELFDWNSNTKIKIPYNYLKTPSENASELYKHFKKAKRGILEVEKRIEQVKSEINFIEEEIWYCQNAVTYKDLEFLEESIKDKLTKDTKSSACNNNQKFQRNKQKNFNKTSSYKILREKIIYAKKIKPLLEVNGCKYFVGKNSVQNDIITFTIAKSNDIWCHIQDGAGSHVVIKKNEGKLNEDEIILGASLAVLYSSMKMASKASVMVTKVENIKKAASTRPGHVLVSSYKTIIVSPNLAKDLLEKYFSTNKEES